MPRPDLAVVDNLLTTTRAVRRRLDLSRPVDPQLVRECLEVALQAPSGSNRQGWHWIVVTDPTVRRALADAYRRGWAAYAGSSSRPADEATQSRMRSSGQYLTDHFHEVPVHVVPCVATRGTEGGALFNASGMYGSIYPAIWSLLLAARARGLGGTITTLHLQYADEAAAVLPVPDGMIQVALIPLAHTVGDDFHPARRRPLDDVITWV
jgi:nitroreductase